MPYTRHDFGIKENFYICSNNAVHPCARTAGVVPTTLVIHSHGDYEYANGQTTTPLELLYQVKEWHAANNGDLANILTQIEAGNEPEHAETAAENAVVQNNRLYKYDVSGPAGYQAVQTLLGIKQNLDILIVRNRKTRLGRLKRVFLQDVFDVLAVSQHRYTRIYGSFCRVRESDPHYRPAGFRPNWDDHEPGPVYNEI